MRAVLLATAFALAFAAVWWACLFARSLIEIREASERRKR